MNQAARGSLLGIEHLGAEEILGLLKLARRMNPQKPRPLLRGKRVLLLFYEASTRTRSSFEVAAKSLGAMTTLVLSSGSSIEKGESLLDTGYTLRAVGADVIVIRHPQAGAAALMAKYLDIPVINAGDGMHEHPTQALLDAYTILRHKKTLKGLQVAIVGDIYHSRVARSAIHLLSKFGAHITLCGPPEFLPETATSLAPGTAHHAYRGRCSPRRRRGHDPASAEGTAGRHENQFAGLHRPLSDDHAAAEAGEERCDAHASRSDHPRAGVDLGSGGLSAVGDCRRGSERSAGAHGDSGQGAGKSEMRVTSPRRHRDTEKFFRFSLRWFAFSVAPCLRGERSLSGKAI